MPLVTKKATTRLLDSRFYIDLISDVLISLLTTVSEAGFTINLKLAEFIFVYGIINKTSWSDLAMTI